jgi:predicted RNA methylase
MLEMAEVNSEDVVYDLGSGDGIVIEAARRYKAHAIGIEADPIRYI